MSLIVICPTETEVTNKTYTEYKIFTFLLFWQFFWGSQCLCLRYPTLVAGICRVAIPNQGGSQWLGAQVCHVSWPSSHASVET